MTIFGADLPVTGWTYVVLVAGAAVSVLVWLLIGRKTGWRHWRSGATLCALLSLTVVLALTLIPKGNQPALGLAACIPYDWDDFVYNVFHTGGGVAGDALNLFLMVPLTVSLVLATRRVFPIMLLGALLPLGIELIQTQLPGRSCAVSDLVTNSAGAVAGATVGWVIEARSRRTRHGLSAAGTRLVESPSSS